jgi:hypothetical protein
VILAERRSHKGHTPLGIGALAVVATVTASACSVGEGSGSVEGTLNVPDCWSGRFALDPDFFAGVPHRRSLQLRIQEGGDYTNYSDGINILVRDIDAVLSALLGRNVSLRSQAPSVALREADRSPVGAPHDERVIRQEPLAAVPPAGTFFAFPPVHSITSASPRITIVPSESSTTNGWRAPISRC